MNLRCPCGELPTISVRAGKETSASLSQWRLTCSFVDTICCLVCETLWNIDVVDYWQWLQVYGSVVYPLRALWKGWSDDGVFCVRVGYSHDVEEDIHVVTLVRVSP